jgi:hypothetical protein
MGHLFLFLIPGNKVTLEESSLDFSLAKYSCNIIDLLKFIESVILLLTGPFIEFDCSRYRCSRVRFFLLRNIREIDGSLNLEMN